MSMQIEFSKKQLEYIRLGNKHWNFKIGATQCGKTHVDVAYVIPARIIERLGKKGLVFIIGVSKSTIERNILEPMREIWGDKLVGEINSENKVFLFGEWCYALGSEKISQVSKFRGARAKYIYWDEIVEANQEVFELVKTRLSFDYSIADATGNPSAPNHFIKEFIETEGLDLYSQSWTLFDNPFLPKSYVENICKELSGTVFYDRYILGLWKRAEGAIYRQFCDNPEEYIIDEEDIPDMKIMGIRAGVDFGGNKSAQAFICCGFSANFEDFVVLEENVILNNKLTPAELEKEYIKFAKMVYNKYKQPFETYYDNAETTLSNGLKDAVVIGGVPNLLYGALKKSIIDRIRCTIILMGGHKLKIKRNCKNLIKAFQDAVWNEKKLEDERLDDGSYCVDILDAFEYCIERDMELLVNLGNRGMGLK